MTDIHQFLKSQKEQGSEIRIPRDLVGSRWVIVEAILKNELVQAVFQDGKQVYTRTTPIDKMVIKDDFIDSEAFLDSYKSILPS